jgi:hypothetical protein
LSMNKPSTCALGSVALLPALHRWVSGLFGIIAVEERHRSAAECNVLAGVPVDVMGVKAGTRD